MSEQIQMTVAKLEERLDQHDRRITKNEDLTVQIHEIAASVRNLSADVKGIAERMDKMLSTIDERLKNQGERIGGLESRGSKKYEEIIRTAIAVVATAIGTYFISSFVG